MCIRDRGSTVSSVISFSGASIPAGVADKVQQQPHVKLAMGVINHPVDLPLFITGMDVAKFTQMSGGFTFDQGGPLQGPDDILVDRYYACLLYTSVTDRFTISRKAFT